MVAAISGDHHSDEIGCHADYPDGLHENDCCRIYYDGSIN